MRLSQSAGRLCLFLAIAGPACPQEFYSWHTHEIASNLTERSSIVFHTRLRSRQSFQHLAQFRAGVLLGYNFRGFNLTGGYYVEPNHPLDSEWQSGHRLTTSVSRSFPLRPRFTATPRLNMDRFFTVVRGDFNRFRSGVRWDYGRLSGPYMINEVMFSATGFQSTRHTAGWRVRPLPQVQFEAGYVYDVRTAYWGGNRQAIITVMRYQLGD